MLSSFVHGHHWAAVKLSYRRTDDGAGPYATLVQSVDPFVMVGHLVKAALWFARPIWYRSRLNGFDLTRLREILEAYADRKVTIAETERFWRDGA